MPLPLRNLAPALPFALLLTVACHEDGGPSQPPPMPTPRVSPSPGATPPPGGGSGQVSRNLGGGGMTGSFVASNNGINRGTGAQTLSSTLTWNIANARSCELNGQGVPPQGRKTVTPEVDTTYTLVCKSDTGEVRNSLDIAVARIDKFVSDKTAVFDWESHVLSWESSHTTSCYASTAGSYSTARTFKGPGTYLLTCTGFNGDRLQSKLVVAKKTDAPIVSFSLSRSEVAIDSLEATDEIEVEATWDVQNVRSCKIVPPGYGSAALYEIDPARESHGKRLLKFKLDRQDWGPQEKETVELQCAQVEGWDPSPATVRKEVRFAWMKDAKIKKTTPFAIGERAKVEFKSANLTNCSVSAFDGGTNGRVLPVTLGRDYSSQISQVSFVVGHGGRHVLTCQSAENHPFIKEFDLETAEPVSNVSVSTLRFRPDTQGVSRSGLTYEPGMEDSATLEWSTIGATRCRWTAASEPGKKLLEEQHPEGMSGAFTVRTGDRYLKEDETFTLVCQDSRGTESSSPFKVEVAPIGLQAQTLFLNEGEKTPVTIHAEYAPGVCKLEGVEGISTDGQSALVGMDSGEVSKTVKARCGGFSNRGVVEKKITLQRLATASSLCTDAAEQVPGSITIKTEHAYELLKHCRSVSGNLVLSPEDPAGEWARSLVFDLQEANDIEIQGTKGIASVSFPSLRVVRDFTIEENSDLRDVTFPSDVKVESHFSVKNNAMLGSVSIPSSARTAGIAGNPLLHSFNNISKIESVPNLSISNNRISGFVAPEARVVGIISFNSERQLREVSFPKATTISSLELDSTNVETLDFPDLQKFQRIAVRKSPLAKLSLSSVKESGNLEIAESGASTGALEISWPACFSGNVGLRGNLPSLKHVAIPFCKGDSRRNIDIVGNPGLQTVMLTTDEEGAALSVLSLLVESNPVLEKAHVLRMKSPYYTGNGARISEVCSEYGLVFRENGSASVASQLELEKFQEGNFCVERNPGLARVSFSQRDDEAKRSEVEQGRIRHNPGLTSIEGIEFLQNRSYIPSSLAIYDNPSFRWTRTRFEGFMNLPFSTLVTDPEPLFAPEVQ